MDYVYLLWDDQNGIDISAAYEDLKSAGFALRVRYSEYAIESGKAKIEKVKVFGFR